MMRPRRARIIFGHGPAGHPVGPGEVGVDDPRPGLLLHGQQELIGVDAGVGDQDLDRPELLLHPGEGGVDLRSEVTSQRTER